MTTITATRAWQRLSARVLRAWRGEYGDPGCRSGRAVLRGRSYRLLGSAANRETWRRAAERFARVLGTRWVAALVRLPPRTNTSP